MCLPKRAKNHIRLKQTDIAAQGGLQQAELPPSCPSWPVVLGTDVPSPPDVLYFLSMVASQASLFPGCECNFIVILLIISLFLHQKNKDWALLTFEPVLVDPHCPDI